MYLYYILGWRLNRKYIKMFEEGAELNSLKDVQKVRPHCEYLHEVVIKVDSGLEMSDYVLNTP